MQLYRGNGRPLRAELCKWVQNCEAGDGAEQEALRSTKEQAFLSCRAEELPDIYLTLDAPLTLSGMCRTFLGALADRRVRATRPRVLRPSPTVVGAASRSSFVDVW